MEIKLQRAPPGMLGWYMQAGADVIRKEAVYMPAPLLHRSYSAPLTRTDALTALALDPSPQHFLAELMKAYLIRCEER